MFKTTLLTLLLASTPLISSANSEAEIKKTYLEDIFIWKMSDELKLSAKQEKKFTEIHKFLNKEKSELNKKIQEIINSLPETASEPDLKKIRQLLSDYNQVSLKEYDLLKKLLDNKKFTAYLKIKAELTNKMKSMLIGERSSEKKDQADKKLPTPKVIVEKPD